MALAVLAVGASWGQLPGLGAADPFAAPVAPGFSAPSPLRLRFKVEGYSPSEPLAKPESIAYDARRDVLYLADTGRGRIIGLNRQGVARFQITSPLLARPSSLAVEGSGNLLALDGETGRIHRFDPQGKPAGMLELPARKSVV